MLIGHVRRLLSQLNRPISSVPKLCSTSTGLLQNFKDVSATTPVVSKLEQEVYFIKLNRPDKRNCINTEMARMLKAEFEAFDANERAKCAILYGGGGNFCSGYDLAEVSSNQAPIIEAPIGPTHMLTHKPIIAAVEGYCVAGGFELALLADMILCEENSIFGVYNRRFGIPLIDGGTVRLPKIVGFNRAMNIILTGRSVDSAEAKQIGLVSCVSPVGTVLGVALNMAIRINKFPQECLLADRRSTYYSTFEAKSMKDALDFEYYNGHPILEREGRDGAKKFVELGIGRHGKFKIHDIDEILARDQPELL